MVTLKRNELELSPNGTLFHLYAMKSESGFFGSLGHKNLTASASSGCSAMLRNAFSFDPGDPVHPEAH
jgi:hypothetical protein